MGPPNLPKPAATTIHAVHVGLGRPIGRVAKIEHVVDEVEKIGGVTQIPSLGVPSVLARADDGPRHVLITVGPHDGPTDALTRPFLVTVDAAPLGRASSPGQRLGQDGPVAMKGTALVQNVNANRVPVVLIHDVRLGGRPEPSVTPRPDAQDVRHRLVLFWPSTGCAPGQNIQSAKRPPM